MWKEYLINIFNNNRGKCIGILTGVIFGILVLIIGFFKSLFIVICAILGYYIGKKVDNNESIVEILEKILPNGWK